MTTISLGQQRVLGRELDRARENTPDSAPQKEQKKSGGMLAQISPARDFPFVFLGGFALLKDMMDIVFFSLLGFASNWTTAGKVAGGVGTAGDALYVGGKAAAATGVGVKAGAVMVVVGKILSWGGAAGEYVFSSLGEGAEAAMQGAALIFPSILTLMFWIATVMTLLLVGLGWKSFMVVKNPYFFLGSISGFIAEFIPGFNFLPGTMVYVIFLYLIVLRERKKKGS